MRISFAGLLVVLITGSSPAQTLAPVSIVVDEDGLYEVPYALLSPLIDARRLQTDSLGLFRLGTEVPIQIRGGRDGRFDPGDSIIFWGERNRGPHSHDSAYILKRSRNPRRIRKLEVQAGTKSVDEAWRHVVIEEDEILAPIACVRQEVIRGPAHDHWYWKRMPAPITLTQPSLGETTATFLCEIHPEPRRKVSARLFIDVLGPAVPGIDQKIVVNVNGRDLEPVTWNTPLEKRIELRVPVGIIERKNSVQIRNLSRVPAYAEADNEVGQRLRNAIYINRITFEVPTLLLGPARDDGHLIYYIPRESLKTTDPLRFRSMTREGSLTYDVGHHALGRGGLVKIGPRKEVVVACIGMGGLKEPKRVDLLRRTDAHLPGPGADWVVVTTSRFRPQVKALAEHRRKGGFTPLIIEARELYDTFTHGDFDPKAIGMFVRKAHQDWKKKPRYLLLVGDADHGADWISTKETIPTHLVMTDYNGATATDAPFGDVNGDGTCEVMVGRFPVRSRDDLLTVISRTIDLERRPPPGAWRRRVRFVAGEARFNPMIDGIIERTFRRVVSKEIPAAFRMSMTYGNPDSPFYWPAGRFSDRVISELNQGALVMTYVGHGSTRAFDRIRDPSGGVHPILDVSSVPKIDARGRNAILAIIACWTGNFDQPGRDSISELLLRKRGGPAAIVASSRISHPYPDALFGLGLARAFFKSRKPLGDVFEEARGIMMQEASGSLAKIAKPFLSKAIDPDTLVKDHLWLYNLLGDPALKIPFPEHELTLTTKGPIHAGQPLEVHVACGAAAGRLLLSLDRPLSRQGKGLTKPDPASNHAEAMVIANHRKANDPTVASSELDVKGGNVKLILDLPGDLKPGSYHLNAYLVGGGKGDALGTVAVKISK